MMMKEEKKFETLMERSLRENPHQVAKARLRDLALIVTVVICAIVVAKVGFAADGTDVVEDYICCSVPTDFTDDFINVETGETVHIQDAPDMHAGDHVYIYYDKDGNVIHVEELHNGCKSIK